jgi:hypothetical protein
MQENSKLSEPCLLTIMLGYTAVDQTLRMREFMSKEIFQTLVPWHCPIHGGFSKLNRCAWPDCPHGVADRTVVAKIPGIDRVNTFNRVLWRGVDQDLFFDWQSGTMPSWFGISRPYNYFEIKLIEEDSPDRMFHYTSAEGALAILQSGCMRFTDYAYLNDTREVTYGFDVMRKVLGDDTDLVNSVALSKLRIHLEEEDPLSPYNIYTASFSAAPDSLSQFRLYGPIALGFETNPIGFGYPKGDSHLGRVVYQLEKQIKLLQTFFSIVKQSEEYDTSCDEEVKSKSITMEYLVYQLLRISALFKHPTFSDEKEIRLLYYEPLDIMGHFKQDTAQRQFKISGGLIVPFTDTLNTTRVFSSDENPKTPKKLPLKSVVIGPSAQAKVLASGMRDLLNNLGYREVEISLSEAPLRS